MNIAAVLLMFFLLAGLPGELNSAPHKNIFNLYNEAITAYRNRKFSEAKEKFSQILDDPDDSNSYKDTARMMLAQILKDGKEHEKAIKLFKEVIEKNMHFGQKLQAQNSIIEIYYVTQRYKDGIEYINSLKKEGNFSYDLDLKLSDFYVQLGQNDEAWLILERAFNLNPQKDIFQKRMELASKTKEIERLTNELKSQKQNIVPSKYIDFLTDCLLALKQRKEAVNELEEYLKQTEDTEMIKKLTRLLADDNMHEKCIEYLERLTEIMPNDAPSAKSLGHEYFVTGNKKKAIEAWQRPFAGRERSNDAAIFYTNALIEHGLYEEALQAFDRYRKLMFAPTKFAGEKANVLYALNRRAEAMEEYLASFVEGDYSQETFDKLYDEKSEDFNLEKRLKELYEKYRNQALAKALLELYFTRNNKTDIDKIDNLVSNADGELDDIFYERFIQDPNIECTEFAYNILNRIIKSRKQSSIQLKFANKAVELAPIVPELTDKFYKLASSINQDKNDSDYVLLAEYYANMAECSLFTMHKPSAAIQYADKIFGNELEMFSNNSAIKAGFVKTCALICEEKLEEAEKNQEKLRKFIDDSSFYDKNSYEQTMAFYDAWLYCNKGDYQQALDKLKPLVDSYNSTDITNDALELALIITRYSIGDGLEALDNVFKVKRQTLAGKYKEAENELTSFIQKNASATAVIADAQADLLLLREKLINKDELIKQIDAFLVSSKIMNKKTADVLDLKIKLLYGNKEYEKSRLQSMKAFVNEFGSDLRSERYRRLIATMENTK